MGYLQLTSVSKIWDQRFRTEKKRKKKETACLSVSGRPVSENLGGLLDLSFLTPDKLTDLWLPGSPVALSLSRVWEETGRATEGARLPGETRSR